VEIGMEEVGLVGCWKSDWIPGLCWAKPPLRHSAGGVEFIAVSLPSAMYDPMHAPPVRYTRWRRGGGGWGEESWWVVLKGLAGGSGEGVKWRRWWRPKS